MGQLTLFLRTLAFLAFVVAAAQSASANDRLGLRFAFSDDSVKRYAEIITQGHLSLYVSGEFREGDTARFARFVRDNKLEMATVIFDSPGGSLFEGIALGRLIRKLRFDTDIGSVADEPGSDSSAICASACAYAFAGGELRSMRPGGLLGLHQFRSGLGDGVSESVAQTVSAILVSYLSEMGVDSNAFAIASVTNPDQMIWLNPDDAMQIGFLNSGFFPTSAEIRLMDMKPYLRLNQVQPSLNLRVLILCWERSIIVQAGIVTDPEQSADIVDPDWAKRSYLELDAKELLPIPGVRGAKAQESTVWVERGLSVAQSMSLMKAGRIGIWIDGYGAVRFGGSMDLAPVKDAVADYIKQCYAS